MLSVELGTRFGHLHRNQGKSRHIISIYPDAIPISQTPIPAPMKPILAQTAFANWRSHSLRSQITGDDDG